MCFLKIVLLLLLCCFTTPRSGAALDCSGKRNADPGNCIVAISSAYLGAPYTANTLIGGPEQPERLVTDMAGFDCFTFLDTVEAMRRSSTRDGDFATQLIHVRYRNGIVEYAHRRHFFSDWTADKDSPIVDVTQIVGQGKVVSKAKQLNLKQDGSLWLPGIAVASRLIHYIPVAEIDSEVLGKLQSGDYLGVYSDAAGLDVSHTGIVVKEGDHIRLRHASSRAEVERVTDEDLMHYLQGKPGIVVYRVR